MDKTAEQEARDYIATLKNMIEQERMQTISRCEQYREFLEGDKLKAKLRAEWEHFYDRVEAMEKDIANTMQLLCTLESLRTPITIIVTRPGVEQAVGDGTK